MSFSDSIENLKKFDVNDLDFNNAGSWPALIKLIVFVIVAVLIVGGGYWFMVKDQYGKLSRAEGEEAKLKKTFEQEAFKVANLESYKIQMLEMEQSFDALVEQLPAQTEVPDLLEDITNTGLGSGLDIKTIKLNDEISKEFYVELPINIEIEGIYHDMAAFVSGVAALPRIVTLHDFVISRVSDNASKLSMEIDTRTYRYQSDDEKQAAKAARKAAKRGKK